MAVAEAEFIDVRYRYEVWFFSGARREPRAFDAGTVRREAEREARRIKALPQTSGVRLMRLPVVFWERIYTP